MFKRVLVSIAIIGAVACGSSGSPASPSSSTTSSAPTNFAITLQQVTFTANLITVSWSGSGTTYRVLAGAAPGGSEALSVDVTGTSYTWTAPRTANIYYIRVAATSGGQLGTASQELPVFTIDMRNVIDALFFGYGPMSDANGALPASSVAVWADGTAINLTVTNESGDVSLTAAKAFVNDYLTTTSNFITVSYDTTATTYKGVSLSAIPLNAVIVRVDNTICPGTGVIACAYYGPLPYGPGRSFVNLNLAPSPGVSGGSVAITHEVGHAFGLHHLVQNSSARAEFKFLMNPTLVSDKLSDVEKTAIALARANGIRPGYTRAQALSAGLVLPASGSGSSGVFSAFRDDLVEVLRGPFQQRH